jgi:uncharacterized protein (TIGR03790 family)
MVQVSSVRRFDSIACGRKTVVSAIALAIAALGSARAASAQSAENVAVVINDRSADSRTIGEYYAAKRGVPAGNVFRLRTALDEDIDRATFNSSIDQPLRALITARGLHDRVLYLVLTKDIPLRIRGTEGPVGTAATVDSELTLLYRRLVGTHAPIPGTVPNPYYAADSTVASVKPFTHRTQDIFLVSRLDGPSVQVVLALIDRGLAPASDGVVRLTTTAGETERVHAAADMVAAQSRAARVSLDTDTQQPGDRWLGYYGVPLTEANEVPFAPGSIAAFSAYVPVTFRHQQPRYDTAYAPRTPPPRTVGDLLQHGLTGVAADIASPETSIRPDILFPAYLAGASIVEAAYLSMTAVGGNTVVLGDPLCAPFRRTILTSAEIEDHADPVTGLPAVYSRQRVAELAAAVPFVPSAAIALVLGADTRMHAGDPVGQRALLERAVSIAPGFAFAQFNLGALDSAEGYHDAAIDRYRLALDAEPPSARDIRWAVTGYEDSVRVRPAALSNLAYALAVYRHAPEEALPLARTAFASSPDNPSVLDTLAWIEYLLGDTANALLHIRQSLALKRPSTAVQLHAAEIFTVAGAIDEAESLLQEVLRRQPSLAGSEDVARVRARRRDGEAHK